jgi:hypothetical protein
MAENILYYGDNLEILRRYIKDESVDLVYLDPPFKSDQDYNILFAERNGSHAAAQIKAFEDTWHWDKISAAAYKVQRRNAGLEPVSDRWQDVATAIETESTLVEQPKGAELEYRVIAINKSGEGSPSNTVMAVL